MPLSIIIPTLNEAETIVQTLRSLQTSRTDGHQLIVADGGSVDATRELATPLVDAVIETGPGRARQMNAGAELAQGDTLLFLHADTRLPPDAADLVMQARRQYCWGRFDVIISGHHALLPIIAAGMNLRSRLSGIATGDQAIFVDAALFRRLGGFSNIRLMEDIELCRRLRRIARPACLRERVVTSGRRWLTHGVLRTVVRMWLLRLAYFSGVDPARLARHYFVR